MCFMIARVRACFMLDGERGRERKRERGEEERAWNVGMLMLTRVRHRQRFSILCLWGVHTLFTGQREREREKERERKSEKEGERERNVEYVQSCYFYFQKE